MTYTPEQVAIALANQDFIEDFNDACCEAGGGSWDSMKHLTLEQAMNTLARNGIRVSYSEDWHMDEYLCRAKMITDVLPFLLPAPIFLPSAPISA